MAPLNHEHIRPQQLAFVGKLMAGVSHEFKNHLAIIREMSGLLGDLLAARQTTDPAANDRFKKILSGIDERIVQAAAMCTALSGFSHRMDQSLSSFNVNDGLQEEIDLLQRFAIQKKIKLESSFTPKLPALYNDCALLQFACFCIIQPALQTLEYDGRILVSTTKQGNGVKVVVQLTGQIKVAEEGSPTASLSALLPSLAQQLQADLSFHPGPDSHQETHLTLSSIKT